MTDIDSTLTAEDVHAPRNKTVWGTVPLWRGWKSYPKKEWQWPLQWPWRRKTQQAWAAHFLNQYEAQLPKEILAKTPAEIKAASLQQWQATVNYRKQYSSFTRRLLSGWSWLAGWETEAAVLARYEKALPKPNKVMKKTQTHAKEQGELRMTDKKNTWGFAWLTTIFTVNKSINSALTEQMQAIIKQGLRDINHLYTNIDCSRAEKQKSIQAIKKDVGSKLVPLYKEKIGDQTIESRINAQWQAACATLEKKYEGKRSWSDVQGVVTPQIEKFLDLCQNTTSQSAIDVTQLYRQLKKQLEPQQFLPIAEQLVVDKQQIIDRTYQNWEKNHKPKEETSQALVIDQESAKRKEFLEKEWQKLKENHLEDVKLLSFTREYLNGRSPQDVLAQLCTDKPVAESLSFKAYQKEFNLRLQCLRLLDAWDIQVKSDRDTIDLEKITKNTIIIKGEGQKRTAYFVKNQQFVTQGDIPMSVELTLSNKEEDVLQEVSSGILKDVFDPEFPLSKMEMYVEKKQLLNQLMQKAINSAGFNTVEAGKTSLIEWIKRYHNLLAFKYHTDQSQVHCDINLWKEKRDEMIDLVKVSVSQDEYEMTQALKTKRIATDFEKYFDGNIEDAYQEMMNNKAESARQTKDLEKLQTSVDDLTNRINNLNDLINQYMSYTSQGIPKKRSSQEFFDGSATQDVPDVTLEKVQNKVPVYG